jgi:rare lipoprotein A
MKVSGVFQYGQLQVIVSKIQRCGANRLPAGTVIIGIGATGPSRNLGRRLMENAFISKTWLKGSVIASLMVTLTACEQMESMGLDGDPVSEADAPALPSVSGATEERDVEAPEVFQKTDTGLWDGRPSLGGVWVAHPDVTDPERVIIRNDTNGKFVIGALFRRERDNPGPALQVSSDAAQELGMLAGSPATLNVVALRREEVAVAPPATTDFDAPVDITATSLDDPIAAATAAVIAAEAATPSTPVAAAPTPAPTPAPRPASTLTKPFIQIGIFSVESNANNTATSLRRDGMSATVLAQTSQGKPFWRVIVGPSPTSTDRAAILQKVQALGFADAYFVTN